MLCLTTLLNYFAFLRLLHLSSLQLGQGILLPGRRLSRLDVVSCSRVSVTPPAEVVVGTSAMQLGRIGTGAEAGPSGGEHAHVNGEKQPLLRSNSSASFNPTAKRAGSASTLLSELFGPPKARRSSTQTPPSRVPLSTLPRRTAASCNPCLHLPTPTRPRACVVPSRGFAVQ